MGRYSLHYRVKDFLTGEDSRCSNCNGWPVRIGDQFQPAKCGYCDEEVDEEIVEKYFKIKSDIANSIESNQKMSVPALKYLQQMTSICHPQDLTFIFMCQMALIESIENNDIQNTTNMTTILYAVLSKLLPKTDVLNELREIQERNS